MHSPNRFPGRVLPMLVLPLLALAVLALPGTLAAQVPPAGTGSPYEPVERLGRYIRTLTGTPRDLTALLGAGQAALDVGDPNAALGFFARAEDVAPSSARAKAGLGSSLVMIERPDDALRLFGEAVSLGADEATIARDRGLAYDLRGDAVRAQRDYALAETHGHGDDELTRRWALSLAYTGSRAAALAKLDPLLRRQDQGAWRARAFVLAMTGDVPGANGVARSLMPTVMADAMAPLLARLATLDTAGRAHAVTFGTVPADGTRLAGTGTDPYLVALTSQPVRPIVAPPTTGAVGMGLIPQGEPLGPRSPVTARQAALDPIAMPRGARQSLTMPGARSAPSDASGPATLAAMPSVLATKQPVAVAPAVLVSARPVTAAFAPAPAPRPAPAPAQTPAPSSAAARSNGASAFMPRTALPTALASAPREIAGPPAAAAGPYATSQSLADGDARAITGPTQTDDATPVRVVTPAPVVASGSTVAALRSALATPGSATTAPRAGRLDGLLAGVAPEAETIVELPSAREVRIARQAARRRLAELASAAAIEREAALAKAEAAALAKRHPSRIWVQVATGANTGGLATTWRRIRDDNTALLKGKSGWSAPYRSTNRVLVGPLKSTAAARELVRALMQNDVRAMLWESAAGDEVAKIATP